jgi:hypothetical protein
MNTLTTTFGATGDLPRRANVFSQRNRSCLNTTALSQPFGAAFRERIKFFDPAEELPGARRVK